MKKILILVLSCELQPYKKMVETSLRTWDTVQVKGCETVYYFGASNNTDTGKFIYLPINETLVNMGAKTLAAFEWALNNKDFDYIARPHSCIYVNKKELMNYVDGLPNQNVFAGIKVNAVPEWSWGGCGYVFSRDIIQKLVDNKGIFAHGMMEDIGISYMANELGIPFTNGRGCSIDKKENGWICLSYGGCDSFDFNDFSEISKSKGQFFYRIKQDGKRYMEEFIMEEMFRQFS